MILYYVPFACSLADHIALIESRLPFTLERVVGDRANKRTSDGRDYHLVNPRGVVPALQLESGEIIAENLAILCHIADCSDSLIPRHPLGRARTLEALSYMATTVHGNLGAFFFDRPEVEKQRAREALEKAYDLLSVQMGDNAFLLGETISIADPYLFWALLAANKMQIEVPRRLQDYVARMNLEPSVEQALAAERLSAAG